MKPQLPEWIVNHAREFAQLIQDKGFDRVFTIGANYGSFRDAFIDHLKDEIKNGKIALPIHARTFFRYTDPGHDHIVGDFLIEYSKDGGFRVAGLDLELQSPSSIALDRIKLTPATNQDIPSQQQCDEKFPFRTALKQQRSVGSYLQSKQRERRQRRGFKF